MTAQRATTVLNIVFIITIIGVGFFWVHRITANPCASTKTFTVTGVDPRFGISKETVASYSAEAAQLWNNAYTENALLSPVAVGGDIKIELIYDERQRTTIQNERLKQTIGEEKEDLDDLKTTIEALKLEQATLESDIETQTASYNVRLNKHNSEVASWNQKGGAPSGVYQRLERERAELETERIELNSKITRYNTLASRIRAYARDHNDVVETINTKIYKLNETALREFEEGTYDPSTATITIYEFGSPTILKRVLAHELGHALTLDHVEDTEAIMHAINRGKAFELTQADKDELFSVCKELSLEDAKEALRIIRDDIFRLLE